MRWSRSHLSTSHTGGSKLTMVSSDPNEFARQLSRLLFSHPAGTMPSDPYRPGSCTLSLCVSPPLRRLCSCYWIRERAYLESVVLHSLQGLARNLTTCERPPPRGFSYKLTQRRFQVSNLALGLDIALVGHFPTVRAQCRHVSQHSLYFVV